MELTQPQMISMIFGLGVIAGILLIAFIALINYNNNHLSEPEMKEFRQWGEYVDDTYGPDKPKISYEEWKRVNNK